MPWHCDTGAASPARQRGGACELGCIEGGAHLLAPINPLLVVLLARGLGQGVQTLKNPLHTVVHDPCGVRSNKGRHFLFDGLGAHASEQCAGDASERRTSVRVRGRNLQGCAHGLQVLLQVFHLSSFLRRPLLCIQRASESTLERPTNYFLVPKPCIQVIEEPTNNTRPSHGQTKPTQSIGFGFSNWDKLVQNFVILVRNRLYSVCGSPISPTTSPGKYHRLAQMVPTFW